MSMTARVFTGLALGLALGLAGAATRHPALLALSPIVEPVGTLWLNGLQMTVVPLVVSLLVTGVAATREAAVGGRVGVRTLVVIAGLLIGAVALGTTVTTVVVALSPVDPATAAAFRDATGAAPDVPTAIPSPAEWVVGLVPPNPIRAAAEGAMLPLVVFSLLLGLAASRLGAETGAPLLAFFRALGEAMMVVVHWVLLLAPVGVFALMFPVVLSAGLSAVGVLGRYVLLIAGLAVLATALLYPLASLLGRVPVRRFARAVAPAQAVALSTQSSLASLPAMLEGARSRLGLPDGLPELVLPLAVSLMRMTGPMGCIAAAVFMAAVFRVDPPLLQVAAGAAVAVVTGFGGVGLPGPISFMALYVPVFLTLGVPLEAIGLLLAVDFIPDAFQTVGNVTADVAAVVLVGRDGAASNALADAASAVGTA